MTSYLVMIFLLVIKLLVILLAGHVIAEQFVSMGKALECTWQGWWCEGWRAGGWVGGTGCGAVKVRNLSKIMIHNMVRYAREGNMHNLIF